MRILRPFLTPPESKRSIFRGALNGSHHILYKPGHLPVAVPVHGNRDLGIGLFKSIERTTGVKLRG
ncbi:MAG: type II toxin-antitoxin system HicA family toxin [Gammaproteobacteria bacterium]